MWDQLLGYDEALYLWINDLHVWWLDYVMIFWRTKINWIPLYLFVLAWLFIRWHRKKVLIYISVLLLVIGLGDGLSSQIIKKSIKRERPCRTLEDQAKVLVHCGGGYSFTSSHAVNHFGVAIFFVLGFFRHRLWMQMWWIIWACMVAVAQVYVGVHYPFDVIFGGLLGVVLGYLGYRLWRLLDSRLNVNKVV